MELRLNAGVGSPHPELRDGETFISYCNQGGFDAIGLTSKRAGTTVIDDCGKDVTEEATRGNQGAVIFPVFANTEEQQCVYAH